jgi:hypothetical protein
MSRFETILFSKSNDREMEQRDMYSIAFKNKVPTP